MLDGTWLALLRLARFSLFLPIMVTTQVLLADERYQSGYALADTLPINHVFPTQPTLTAADATGMTAVMLASAHPPP
ncbi:MAG: hypothetical protein KJ069_18445 [Anaerolineae bacterium]|nr:hypothetical protein [Anaerolineae bacterium]